MSFFPLPDVLYIYFFYIYKKAFWHRWRIPEVLISRHLIPRFFLLKRNIIFNLSGLKVTVNLVMLIPFIIRRLAFYLLCQLQRSFEWTFRLQLILLILGFEVLPKGVEDGGCCWHDCWFSSVFIPSLRPSVWSLHDDRKKKKKKNYWRDQASEILRQKIWNKTENLGRKINAFLKNKKRKKFHIICQRRRQFLIKKVPHVQWTNNTPWHIDILTIIWSTVRWKTKIKA